MIIYGKQLFLHILKKYPAKIKSVILAKELEKTLFASISKLGVKVQIVDNQKAQALAHGGNHQGFLAQVDDFEFSAFSSVKKADSVIFLCGISDVGNIGSIMRSAVALGCEALIIANKQGFSDTAIAGMLRTSSGAGYELDICVVNDDLSALNELKQAGFTLLGADMSGQDIKTLDPRPKKFALLMGSEDKGIGKKALAKCDKVVAIKMKNGWESLNVGVATALLFDRIKNG